MHIGICDLRHGREEEERDEESIETGDVQIGSLHIPQAVARADRVGEEDAGGEEGRDGGPDALHGLGEVEVEVEGDLRAPNAAVSSVARPDPTTNMLPQKPPNERWTPDGQNSRQPTANTARPAMKVTRKPYRRSTRPKTVGGP